MIKPDGKLPVVTDTETTDCGGCDRRTVLQGMAVASMVGACRIDVNGGGDDVPLTDAPGGTDGVTGNGFEMCGSNLCVDISHPANERLQMDGGARVIVQGTRRILIGRIDANTYNTTSSVCTHAGCTVQFVLAMNKLKCNCHGSEYMFDGTLTRMGTGAINQQDLQSFDNTFDAATNILTIMLL